MRPSPRAAALGSLIALFAIAPVASATVTEPDGLVVPTDLSITTEVQLSQYFTSVGDPVDEKVDAHSTPDTFNPLCGFNGTFVLNQSADRDGVGWYNSDPADPTPPPASAIHIIVPANSPVGTIFKGTDIRADPNYKGGAIGFALIATEIGGQIHYSEQRYNVVCTSCTPNAPWIMGLIYQSTTTPNAYYLGFEDGAVTPTSFSGTNDGDFNDDVFLFTGLTCAASGQACDTGQKGICANGSLSCQDGTTTCRQTVQPAPKQCNGLDNDCDGAIDDGPCPSGTICTRGSCIPSCGSGEFKCDGSLVCDNGVCVEPSCKGKSCPDGQTCVAGACVDACTGVTCPHGEVCRIGVCVDPCAGVQCGSDEQCVDGLCKLGCQCAGCATGETCDTTSKQCNPTACSGKSCGTGEFCASDGTCADACIGVVCPKGQACTAGACKTIQSGGDGGVGDSGAGDTGIFLSGPDTGTGGSLGEGGVGGDGQSSSSGGCGCRVAEPSSKMPAAIALALGALVLARRRRR